jgi:hypothetical protein
MQRAREKESGQGNPVSNRNATVRKKSRRRNEN